MKTSIPRLRRIRFKDGRTIEVFRRRSCDPSVIMDHLRLMVGNHFDDSGMPLGCAVVLWSADGTTSGRVFNDTPIPGILVPDLVRNVLLGLKIENWTIDTINGH